MPLYEYQCLNCEQVHEVLQSFSAPAEQTCPHCLGPLKKLVSLSSFSLKGTGWYTTDYKKSSKASACTPTAPTQDSSTQTQTPSPQKGTESSIGTS